MHPEQALSLSAPGPAAQRPVRRIQASKGFAWIDIGEIWQYRELLYRFLWRDVKARYKQTLLGGFWAIFRPLSSMILFSVVFGGFVGIKTGDIPYPLFSYCALLPWTYFSSALTSGASSLLNSAGLMSKVYYPRLFAPIAAVCAPLIDFFLSLTIVFGLFAYFQRWPSWHMIFFPAFLVLALLASLGVGLWLCGAIVRYRDVAFALPFVVQLWMYATPVIYPAAIVPDRYEWLLALNPMTAVIDGFRWSLLGTSFPSVLVLTVSAAFTVVVLTCGLLFFRRTERTIVDMI